MQLGPREPTKISQWEAGARIISTDTGAAVRLYETSLPIEAAKIEDGVLILEKHHVRIKCVTQKEHHDQVSGILGVWKRIKSWIQEQKITISLNNEGSLRTDVYVKRSDLKQLSSLWKDGSDLKEVEEQSKMNKLAFHYFIQKKALERDLTRYFDLESESDPQIRLAKKEAIWTLLKAIDSLKPGEFRTIASKEGWKYFLTRHEDRWVSIYPVPEGTGNLVVNDVLSTRQLLFNRNENTVKAVE